jgi:putative ABC transport system permease protein
MRTLDRKLLRELRRHWVQIASIALVMGCGTMTIMGLRGTLTSIRAARDTYYDEYRFADLFAHVERAPSTLVTRLSAIPGIAALETRIVRDVRLDVPALPEPAIGHMVSIPDWPRPMLNDLQVRRGRWPAADATNEVLISERFAEVNHLDAGDHIAAVVNGRWQRLAIVGIAISPEFVVEHASSAVFVDSQRYGIVWASRRMMEGAFDMKAAFNDVVIRLGAGATESAVIQRVDALLEPWGGTPAYSRRDQPAARALEDEFNQLRTNATFFPLFFLVVAAFLLNVVLSRLVASQRDEIAALKAFGYTDREIGWHYLGFGIAAVIFGAIVGIPAGIWMGAKFAGLYHDYFRFPSIPSRVDWAAAGVAVGISSTFALLGTLSGVRRVMRLTPADALRPESPSRFRPLLLERLGLGRIVGPSARMVLRNLERRPVRTASTIVGASLAVALLASGRFPYDAFDRMMDVEFRLAQRYDVLALFTSRTNGDATEELRHVDGVLDVEAFRATPVRVSRGTRWRNTSIVGMDAPSRLNRLIDVSGREFALPAEGVVLTAWLAKHFGVRVGDTLDLDLTEQGGVRRRAVIAGVFDPMMVQGLYMSRTALQRLLREQDVVSGAYLAVEPSAEARVMARLEDLPAVAGAVSRAATIANIRRQMRDSMVFVLTLIITSACIIALGVVYNSARIALSERGRELASLRVLGFTTNEVAGMLLGEQAAMLVFALPVGIVVGAAFSLALARGFETDRFHFPYVMKLASQVFAMSIVAAAAVFAAIVVRRRVRRLDMVSALRTRE